MQVNELIKVYGLLKDGSGVAKTACWNVRINGEVHQMWFGTKRAALGYLTRRGGADASVHHIEAAIRKLER